MKQALATAGAFCYYVLVETNLLNLRNIMYNFSNVTWDEYIRKLSLSNDRKLEDVADHLESFNLIQKDEQDEVDVEYAILSNVEESVELTRWLLTEAVWNVSKRIDATKSFILSGFDENTHPYHQHVELFKKGSTWYLSVGCGFIWKGEDKDNFHGEHGIRVELEATHVAKAKTEAVDYLITNVVSNNLLYAI